MDNIEKMRRYYTITEEGKAALSEVRAKARELANEILKLEGFPVQPKA